MFLKLSRHISRQDETVLVNMSLVQWVEVVKGGGGTRLHFKDVRPSNDLKAPPFPPRDEHITVNESISQIESLLDVKSLPIDEKPNGAPRYGHGEKENSDSK